jgi:PEP-CTERM motif
VSIVSTIERRIMPFGVSSFCRRAACALGALVVGSLVFATPASAGPISVDTYYQFGFSTAGIFATGCDPDDPAGPFCIPSSGTPTTFLDAPAWSFMSGATGSTLSVTDAFLAGDRFQIFDFGLSIGLTSVPVAGTDCGDDPVPCLVDPGMSHGVFALASGAHSITLAPTLSGGGGTGYLLLEDGGGPTAVPEPATLVLLTTGAGMAYYRRRRQP